MTRLWSFRWVFYFGCRRVKRSILTVLWKHLIWKSQHTTSQDRLSRRATESEWSVLVLRSIGRLMQEMTSFKLSDETDERLPQTVHSKWILTYVMTRFGDTSMGLSAARFYHSRRLHVTKHAIAQLVEALRYKPEGRGFDSRWCNWNFSLT
jgi:hypothetical protein